MDVVHVATGDALVIVRGADADPDPDVVGDGADEAAPTVERRLADVDVAPECVAVHPDRPDEVLVGTFDDGPWRSVDGGETFEPVGAGLDASRVTAVATTPGDPDVRWLGTEPSAVYRSTDGGATWRRRPGLTDLPSASSWSFPPRPHTHHVRWIEVDPVDPDRLYVGVEAGALVTSDDGGATWTDRVEGSRRDVHALATHPDAPGRVYCAAGDGYAESTDAGASWAHPQAGLDHRYCWSVAVDPAAPDTRLVAAARGASRAHRVDTAASYVYRTRGDGWERIGTGAGPSADAGTGDGDGNGDGNGSDAARGDGLPTGEGVTRAVLARGAAPGRVYAASSAGLFRTDDAGDAWTRLTGLDLASGTVRGVAVAG